MERSLPSKGLDIFHLANNRNPTKRTVTNMQSAEVTRAETCLEFSIGIGDSNAAVDDIFAVWCGRTQSSRVSAFPDATSSIEVPKRLHVTYGICTSHNGVACVSVSMVQGRVRLPYAPWRSKGGYSPDFYVHPVRRYTKPAPIPSAVQSITS